MIDLSKYITHDLSHTLDDTISGYSDTVSRTIANDGWNARTLSIYSHAGTHMDAPFHFGVSNQTIDDFTPDQLMGKAWIVDINVSKDKELISQEDVVQQIPDYKQGDSLIIRTHWSKKLGEPNYKSGLPRISKELAIWCASERVKLLGVEPLSVADVEDLSEVSTIHNILLGGDVIIIEGLKNLEAIQSKKVFLIALPLKVRNGDGAPARVIALEEKMN